MEAGSAALQRALDETRDAGNRLWLLTRLGEVAAWRGQPEEAEKHYRAALALGIDDGYLLAAWSDFLLDRQRPAEVVKWLAGWEASDGLLLRLALAETALKLPAAKAHVQALADRFAAAKVRGDTTHRAEEARYLCTWPAIRPPRSPWPPPTTGCSASPATPGCCWKRPSRRRMPAPRNRCATGCGRADSRTRTCGNWDGVGPMMRLRRFLLICIFVALRLRCRAGRWRTRPATATWCCRSRAGT